MKKFLLNTYFDCDLQGIHSVDLDNPIVKFRWHRFLYIASLIESEVNPP